MTAVDGMHSNKKNLTELYSYLQNDIIAVKASTGQRSDLAVTTRPAERSHYNAIIRPIRQYNSL